MGTTTKLNLSFQASHSYNPSANQWTLKNQQEGQRFDSQESTTMQAQ